jgi:hypothetical protein
VRLLVTDMSMFASVHVGKARVCIISCVCYNSCAVCVPFTCFSACLITYCSMCGCVRMDVAVRTVKIVLFFPLLPRTPIGRVEDIVRVTVLEGCACLPCVHKSECA